MEIWDCGEAAGGVKAAGIEGVSEKMTRSSLDLSAPCSTIICHLLRYSTKYLDTMQLKILFSRTNVCRFSEGGCRVEKRRNEEPTKI